MLKDDHLGLKAMTRARLARMCARVERGARYLGSEDIGRNRRALACAITEDMHDVIGTLTTARVVLGETAISTCEARDLANEAEKAIVAAEHAVMRYREAILAPHGLHPWKADCRHSA